MCMCVCVCVYIAYFIILLVCTLLEASHGLFMLIMLIICLIDIHHFEVIVHEVSDDGAGPTIGIATCSPLIPTPTCPLLNDYFKWHPDGKCK